MYVLEIFNFQKMGIHFPSGVCGTLFVSIQR